MFGMIWKWHIAVVRGFARAAPGEKLMQAILWYVL